MALLVTIQLEFEFSASLAVVPRTPRRAYRRRLSANVVQLVFDFSVAIELASTERLVEEFLDGNALAGDELFSRYDNLFKSYADKIARLQQLPEGYPSHIIGEHRKQAHEEARGQLQSHAATKVLEGKYTQRVGMTFGAWLQSVLSNFMLDVVRKHRRGRSIVSIHDENPEIDSLIGQSSESMVTQANIAMALATLTEQERAVAEIIMAGDRGENEDLRKSLRISKYTYKRVRHSALEKLRSFFGDDEVASPLL